MNSELTSAIRAADDALELRARRTKERKAALSPWPSYEWMYDEKDGYGVDNGAFTYVSDGRLIVDDPDGTPLDVVRAVIEHHGDEGP